MIDDAYAAPEHTRLTCCRTARCSSRTSNQERHACRPAAHRPPGAAHDNKGRTADWPHQRDGPYPRSGLPRSRRFRRDLLQRHAHCFRGRAAAVRCIRRPSCSGATPPHALAPRVLIAELAGLCGLAVWVWSVGAGLAPHRGGHGSCAFTWQSPRSAWECGHGATGSTVRRVSLQWTGCGWAGVLAACVALLAAYLNLRYATRFRRTASLSRPAGPLLCSGCGGGRTCSFIGTVNTVAMVRAVVPSVLRVAPSTDLGDYW